MTSRMNDVCSHYGVKSLSQLPQAAFIYPEFFPKGGLIWTLERLDYLSLADRKTVSDELRDIFLTQGAKAYGEHLLKRVRELGSHANRRATVNLTVQPPKKIQERIERIKASKSKKTIIGMAEGEAA